MKRNSYMMVIDNCHDHSLLVVTLHNVKLVFALQRTRLLAASYVTS